MISYKLIKNNNASSANYGRYYARAVMTDEFNLEAIAERIQRNCSMKKSDVLGVLTEMVEVMRDELQASHTVRIDGLGTFKVGIKSRYAKTDSEFNAAQHIYGSRVNFRPEYSVVATGTYVDDEGNTKVKKTHISDLTKDLKFQMY
ncbi:MAG: HU family DNA-binding protein [Prevotellaceae bacterium]|nr:HU family DNA-binding protein [Prevotellaceae bacterium]